jgi:membrane protein DedA with SNARE-associated domain
VTSALRWLRRRGRTRNAGTAAVSLMVVCLAALGGSATGRRTGDIGWWIGGATVGGFAGAGSLYLLGRAHEAARTERNPR